MRTRHLTSANDSVANNRVARACGGHWLLILLALILQALTNAGPILADDDSSEYEEPELSATDADHWSFRPLVQPAVPACAANDWCRNEIDAFILDRLQQKGLMPQSKADRMTLIRRLQFDLTGLPPTVAELDAFCNEPAADAYQQLINRLLASPHYGARWGQFWLDLARFAETDGFEHDKVRSNAWHYRDWVVTVANQDLPYDRFMMLQIAGDLMHPGDETARTATAFCLSGPDMPDINSQQERKHYLLNEMAGTVGSVFLGLQLGCAQCHDHMFDPVSQADFYRLRAYFEDAVQVQRDESVFCLSQATEPATSRIWIRGNWTRPGPQVHADVPRVLATLTGSMNDSQLPPRLALAQWLAAPDNPLPARVIANRVWQFHFGRGLCDTPSDFGIAGDQPTHPPLLDWLASELIRSGWSIKHLHRLIVSSATYQQMSRRGAETSEEQWNELLKYDALNLWYGRFPRQRLDGEAIRDAMLLISGQLNDQPGGPGVRPPIAEELRATLLSGQWDVSPRAADHYRRSIYVFARRNLRYPIFELFDRPDANASCSRRNRSTTAPQALLLLNSEFSAETARHLAARCRTATTSLDEAANLAARTAWGRELTSQELQSAQQFFQQHSSSDDALVDALVDYCLALLNANQFVYVD